MAQYGEVIGVYNPDHAKIYEEFDRYFNYPVLFKTHDIENEYSVYMCKIYCLLSTEWRYIVAIIPKDSVPVGVAERLSELPWISFQTRTMPINHSSITPHTYTPKKTSFLSKILTKVNNDNLSATYKCQDLPITVTMLYTKQSTTHYQDKGNIQAALETYQTIITLD